MSTKYTVTPVAGPLRGRKRSVGVGGAIGLGIFAFMILTLLFLFLGAFITMLGFDVLNDHTPLPAYGYWTSFWINIGIGLVLWPHLAAAKAGGKKS